MTASDSTPNQSELRNEPRPSGPDLEKIVQDMVAMRDEVVIIKNEASSLQKKIINQENLLFIGYAVLLVMVATMIVAVLALFIEVLRDVHGL